METPKLSLSGCRNKDNNLAERTIRGPVVARKNAGGSHNGDTARNAAVIFTVTATAAMAGLNLLTYLTAYLDECGRNSGKPLAARRWNGSCRGTRARRTSAPGHSRPRPDRTRINNAVTGMATANRHADHRHVFSQDFRILTYKRQLSGDISGPCRLHKRISLNKG